MKSDKVYKHLIKQYEKKEYLFIELMAFVEQNHSYPEHHWVNHLNSILTNRKTWKETIFTLFVETINAAGGNNLRLNGKSCKQFYQIIESSPNNSTSIKTSQFFSLFSEEVNSLNSFVDYLFQSNKFKNFGQKKAALFLRDLDLLHRKSDKVLFSDYDSSKVNLIIPVDVVITKVLNDFFNMTGNLELKASRHFDLINNFAQKSLKKKYMLLEDLWFWGYYNQTTINKVRQLKLNEDKFYSELYFYPDKKIFEKLKQFNLLLKALISQKAT